MGSIYKITNTVNGKSYIGKTIHDAVNGRINAHLTGKANGSRLVRQAVEKCGQDAFTYEILHDGIIPDFLDELEIEAIAKFNTIAPHGYNLTTGGDGGSHCEEARRKNSDALKGEKNPMYGRTGEKSPHYGKRHTNETLQKMSEVKKGEKNPMYGKPPTKGFLGKRHTDETLQKMSKARIGRKHTDETRRKQSKARMGKKRSEETCRRISESKETSECKAARKIFFSLPADMDLKVKRKHLCQKFPYRPYGTIYSWCKKFDSET